MIKEGKIMDLMYSSTRDAGIKVTASQAILKGLSEDGGLFVPDHIPELGVSLKELSQMTYQETAYEIMKLFFTDFIFQFHDHLDSLALLNYIRLKEIYNSCNY